MDHYRVKEEIYELDDLNEKIGLLNSTLDFNEWRTVNSRKEHKDIFGEQIEEGEVYYKRDLDSRDALILSVHSMHRFLYVLLNGNFVLEEIYEKLKERKIEKLTKALESLEKKE